MERQEKFRPSFLPCFGSRYATTELESWKGQSFRLVVGTFLCNCVIEIVRFKLLIGSSLETTLSVNSVGSYLLILA
ncbi:hypothetical protein V6Z11_A11G291900 [Gossypium hirsutum]